MTSLVFGVLPAFYLSRPNEFKRWALARAAPGGGPARTRAVLVVGQLVMATVLLVGAGLLIRSFESCRPLTGDTTRRTSLAFQLVFPPIIR